MDSYWNVPKWVVSRSQKQKQGAGAVGDKTGSLSKKRRGGLAGAGGWGFVLVTIVKKKGHVLGSCAKTEAPLMPGKRGVC